MHLAEEAWGGGGFVAWPSDHITRQFTWNRFLTINAVAWPAVLVLSVAALGARRSCWLSVAVAGLLALNGLLHLLGSMVTASYSPGVISGVTVYVPLGAFVLARARLEFPTLELLAAVGLGVAAHGLVAVLAFVA